MTSARLGVVPVTEYERHLGDPGYTVSSFRAKSTSFTSQVDYLPLRRIIEFFRKFAHPDPFAEHPGLGVIMSQEDVLA
jgi:hypothetical protein